jgi:hypothetical protein
MKLDPKNVVESLHKIMCSSTSTQADARVDNNDYFKRRVLGFKAEIEFEKLVENYQNIQFLEGGQLISKALSGSVSDSNKFIYTTLSYDKPEKYLEVYKAVSNWSDVGEMFYLEINDNWTYDELQVKDTSTSPKRAEKILKPGCIFWTYNKSKAIFEKHIEQDYGCVLSGFENSGREPSVFPLRKREQFDYFLEYNIDVLKKIYATRYFLDVVLRKASKRKIIDFDGFLQYKQGLSLIEIKEKTPIIGERNPADQMQWKYGWDSRRILWYLYFSSKVNMPIIYNVRHINNRTERKFIQWDSITIDTFLSGSDWSKGRGGGGGEDTMLAPYLFFERVEKILEKLNQ